MARFERRSQQRCGGGASLVRLLVIFVTLLLGISLALAVWLQWRIALPQSQNAGATRISGDANINGGNNSSCPAVECTVVTPKATPDEPSAHGVIRITLRPDVAPIACDYFLQLVQARWYDDVFVFRVLHGFVAQWGAQFNVKTPPPPPINPKRDVDNALSNVRGSLSFAGGDPSSKQVFINLGNNARLDKEGSHPFAMVSDESMQSVVDFFYTGYKDGQGQIPAMKQGDEAMLEQFPKMSKVTTCRRAVV